MSSSSNRQPDHPQDAVSAESAETLPETEQEAGEETETTAQASEPSTVAKTPEAPQEAQQPERDPNEGLSRIAQHHFAAAMAALTLFGAGDLWAIESGLFLAGFVSIANGIIAGYVLAYLAHEWGHFTGARFANARSPVLKQTRQFFFMFEFDMARNSVSQFLSMSRGGPAANWLLALTLWTILPGNTAGQAMLVAASTAIAISVSVFEVPIIRRVQAGGDPGTELRQQLERGVLTTGRNIGIAAGAVLFLILLP
tara:strand:- start:501 stop:1265 length:765 start_codon:yes stop_codon:yes gene_type:complete